MNLSVICRFLCPRLQYRTLVLLTIIAILSTLLFHCGTRDVLQPLAELPEVQDLETTPNIRTTPDMMLDTPPSGEHVKLRDLNNLDPTFSYKWSTAIDEQLERQRTLQHACTSDRKHESLAKTVRTHVHVDDAHRAMYCLIPKVSSTNFLRMLINISGEGRNLAMVNGPGNNLHGINARMKHGIKPLDYHSQEDMEERLANYTKVIIVRNPFHRWLSGFRQKFSAPSYKRLAQRIVRDFRPDATQDEIDAGNIRFDEFLRHIIKKKRKGQTLDQHWDSYAVLCDPCFVKYDIVVKLETLTEDLSFLRQFIFDNSPEAVMPQSDKVQTKKDTLNEYYSSVPLELMEEVAEVFSDDFDMYGYSKEIPT